MNLKPEQLNAHLGKTLAPIYLVGGDEPLQVQEATDAIRAKARQQGYTEREIMNVEKGFEWDSLMQASHSMSLFGDKRILELRMPGSKPGDKGGKALREYAEQPPLDTLLLITCGKMDAATTRTKWMSSLEKAGVKVQVWPVQAAWLPKWIQERMHSRGMQATREAVSLLADKVEGNMLAAAQEIDKLLLLYGSERIDVEEVAAAVADSARFNIYGLVDSAIAGKPDRMVRMLSGLRGEGIDPVLVSWAFTREVRSLEMMASAITSGTGMEAVLAQQRVWERRKPLIRTVLKRHSLAQWHELLQKCAKIDRVIKGADIGQPWDELLQLGMWLSGEKYLRA